MHDELPPMPTQPTLQLERSTVTADTTILDQMKEMFAAQKQEDEQGKLVASRKTGGNLDGEGQEQGPRGSRAPAQKTRFSGYRAGAGFAWRRPVGLLGAGAVSAGPGAGAALPCWLGRQAPALLAVSTSVRALALGSSAPALVRLLARALALASAFSGTGCRLAGPLVALVRPLGWPRARRQFRWSWGAGAARLAGPG
ncbi:hypothetical protein Bca52824_023026 [Brassica carinata]|uniref:Uncharacterized protein n=1 Tax=Brassica carinata TaxID=52824 RepID=A0A8X8AS36_BRACI|nr:hypothetical protein Bca52824_023026 [Brassica carinata]